MSAPGCVVNGAVHDVLSHYHDYEVTLPVSVQVDQRPRVVVCSATSDLSAIAISISINQQHAYRRSGVDYVSKKAYLVSVIRSKSDGEYRIVLKLDEVHEQGFIITVRRVRRSAT